MSEKVKHIVDVFNEHLFSKLSRKLRSHNAHVIVEDLERRACANRFNLEFSLLEYSESTRAHVFVILSSKGWKVDSVSCLFDHQYRMHSLSGKGMRQL